MVTKEPSWIGRGAYSAKDASRLTSIPVRRIQRWLLGYDFVTDSGRHHSWPVLKHDYDPGGKGLWLSFADMIEIRFVDAFLRAGVSLPTIRLAAKRAAALMHEDHPFSSRQFKTDGRHILAEIAGSEGSSELVDLLSNQVAFRRIVDPYLYKGLDFGPANHVERWWHVAGNRKVVIDPARAFGKPIVAKVGIPTRTLYRALAAERSVRNVAAQFEVSEASVRAAIEFERKLAA